MNTEIICEKCKGEGCIECNNNGFVIREISKVKPKTKKETKLKIRRTHIKRNIGFVKNSKPISQYDLEGNFLTLWRNANEVEKCLSIFDGFKIKRKFYRQEISKCARGQKKTAYGFIWKYEVL